MSANELIKKLRARKVCKDGIRRQPQKHEREAADLLESQEAEIERLASDDAIEAAAKAHCDFFGGQGWWDSGLLADTKPRAIEAMRIALQALLAERQKGGDA